MSVGAQPSDKVSVLIKKYGAAGTHLEAQRLAMARMAQGKRLPMPKPVSHKAKPAEAAAVEETAEAPAETAAE